MVSKITLALAFGLASAIMSPAFAGMNGVDYLNYLKLPRATEYNSRPQTIERWEVQQSSPRSQARSGKKSHRRHVSVPNAAQ